MDSRIKSMGLCLLVVLFLVSGCGKAEEADKPPDRESRMRAAIDKAGAYLASQQRPDGSISDFKNPLFNSWETIEALLALRECDSAASLYDVRKGMDFLRENENADGLMCHNVKCKEGYCIETTAEYFELLSEAECEARVSKVQELEQKTGGWLIGNPDVREQQDFPSVTAFALTSIARGGVSTGYRMKGLKWLLSQQTAEGHWGVAWEYYGCPAYALWPVLRYLQGMPQEEVKQARKKAVDYILSAQRKDGSWFYQLAGHAKTVSPELQTGLMLTALLHGAGPEGKRAGDAAIDYLLSRQRPDGSWDGGLFPIASDQYEKREDLFATARILLAFDHYLDMKRPE